MKRKEKGKEEDYEKRKDKKLTSTYKLGKLGVFYGELNE